MSARFALPRKSVNSRGGAAGMASVVMDVPLFTALQRLWYLASMGILKQTVPMYSVCPSPHLSLVPGEYGYIKTGTNVFSLPQPSPVCGNKYIAASGYQRP